MAELGPHRLFLLAWRGMMRTDEGFAPGAADLVGCLRGSDTPFFILTNDVAETPAKHAAWAWAHGLALSDRDFITPSMMAVNRIKTAFPGRPVLVVGGAALRAAVREAGIASVEDVAEAGKACETGKASHSRPVPPDSTPVVLAGNGSESDEHRLEQAADQLGRGAPFLATGPHSVVSGVPPVSPLQRLITASGRNPEIMGKPNPRCVDYALCLRPGQSRSGVTLVGGALEATLAESAGVEALWVASDEALGVGQSSEACWALPDLAAALKSGVGADPMIQAWERASGTAERYF